MNDLNITPGNWSVEVKDGHPIAVVTDGFPKCRLVALVNLTNPLFSPPTPEEIAMGMANATLLSAAPDLLDGCELALKQLGVLNDAHQREHRREHPVFGPLIDSLQACVEKAKGQS